MKKTLQIVTGVISSMALMASVPLTTFASTTNPSQGGIVVTIGSTTVHLDQGQKAEIPFILTTPPTTTTSTSSGSGTSSTGSTNVASPDVNFTGNAGTLSLWPENGRIYWNIVMDFPVTSFSGMLSVSDLTSGLSSGSWPVTTFSGNDPYGAKSGHQYGASLTGAAYIGPVAVAWTNPNYIVWTA